LKAALWQVYVWARAGDAELRWATQLLPHSTVRAQQPTGRDRQAVGLRAACVGAALPTTKAWCDWRWWVRPSHLRGRHPGAGVRGWEGTDPGQLPRAMQLYAAADAALQLLLLPPPQPRRPPPSPSPPQPQSQPQRQPQRQPRRKKKRRRRRRGSSVVVVEVDVAPATAAAAAAGEGCGAEDDLRAELGTAEGERRYERELRQFLSGDHSARLLRAAGLARSVCLCVWLAGWLAV
jgi:hypothetical protein